MTPSAERYPGPRPFKDTVLDRKTFFGRNREKATLLHTILAEDIVVLFGKSGFGKTSLLKAGVLEGLRKAGYWPFVIRLSDPEQGVASQIVGQVLQGDRRVEIAPRRDGDHLGLFFRDLEIWRDPDLLTPVLVFDQFEELFTLIRSPQRRDFVAQFADLARGRVPDGDGHEGAPVKEGGRHRVKMVFAIREDYLGEMEMLARQVPEIKRNEIRLEALSREHAEQAIRGPALLQDKRFSTPAFEFDDGAIKMILDYLCAQRERGEVVQADRVEPFQLQHICRSIEGKVKARRNRDKTFRTVKWQFIGSLKWLGQVLHNFYRDALAHFEGKELLAARRVCEEGLINEWGTRRSVDIKELVEQYKVTEAVLRSLVDLRVLRSEPRVGTEYLELSHDTLVEPIRTSLWERDPPAGYEQAEKLRLERRYGEAYKIFAGVTKSDPSFTRAYLSWGDGLMEERRIAAALALYRKAIEGGVHDATLYHRQGTALAAGGRYEAAIEAFDKALKIDDGVAATWVDLGAALRLSGDLARAIEAYEKALALSPDSAEAYRSLARLHLEGGDPERARKLVDKAKKANPDFAATCEDLLEVLEERRGRVASR